MDLSLLAKHIDTVKLEPFRPAQHVIAQQNTIDKSQQCALKHFDSQLVDLVVLVKED